MIGIYSGEELQEENKVKNRLMALWYSGLGLYGVLIAGFLTWFYLLDYQDSMLLWIKVIIISITAGFGIMSYLFFSIPYKRQKKYIQMLSHLEKGLKEFGQGRFLRFSETIEVREGVDFYHMVVEEWNERRQEHMERKVLLDKQKALPKIDEGTTIMYKTQGNILIEFEEKNT